MVVADGRLICSCSSHSFILNIILSLPTNYSSLKLMIKPDDIHVRHKYAITQQWQMFIMKLRVTQAQARGYALTYTYIDVCAQVRY